MKHILIPILVLMVVSSYALASPQENNEVGDRVVRSAITLKEILNTPDKSVPQDLLDRCACVVVIPGMVKGAFVFGANYGKGVISCRTENGAGPWSAPSMVLMSGGSFGFQIGAQATDLVLVIMNLSGMDSLLDSKFTLGGDASVAAGPVGRNVAAKTDVLMGAKILAYSRSKGVFAGLSLNGEVVRADQDAIFVLYKKRLTPREILFHPMAGIPKDAQIFVDELAKASPKQRK
ncbi:MAG: lipid-binding SYLF domain-containing protein [Acidobacteriota bacterium]|jgi:lipid-binding SYLF domain-containing protein